MTLTVPIVTPACFKEEARMTNDIRLLDVVALTIDKLEHKLVRGEIGTVVKCHPDDGYEVEFVAQDGYTYALITCEGKDLLPLREKRKVYDAASISAES